MRPLSDFSSDACRRVRVVLADIDDTMTRDGKLPVESYQAIWDLSRAGVAVIPVTGRPAGWCDLISRQWPVAGVVGENGAFVFYMEGEHRRTVSHPRAPEPEANRERLTAIAREVYELVPGTRAAKDQFARLYDVAVDFREEPPLLEFAAARRIKEIFESHGARAKISSIHVNAWFGDYDKLSMAQIYLRDHLGLDVRDATANREAVFCGDSPNDEPMFAAFANSVAVANIRPFVDDLEHPPAYLSDRESASGFVELAGMILRVPGR